MRTFLNGITRGGAIMLVAAVGVGVIAPVASADPGTPAVSDASQAVYPPPKSDQVLGDFAQGASEPPGSASAPGSATATATPSGLPFTGLVTPVLLGIGLLALAAGFVLRWIGTDRLSARRS